MSQCDMLAESPKRCYQWIHIEKNRYYRAQIVQDLLGDWVVIQHWGSLLSKQGGHQSIPCDSLVVAEAKVAEIDRRRRYRHYQPMTEGIPQ